MFKRLSAWIGSIPRIRKVKILKLICGCAALLIYVAFAFELYSLKEGLQYAACFGFSCGGLIGFLYAMFLDFSHEHRKLKREAAASHQEDL